LDEKIDRLDSKWAEDAIDRLKSWAIYLHKEKIKEEKLKKIEETFKVR
jgi:hypothetical protein